MAVCFGGKKQKVSQTIADRLASEKTKHNDTNHHHTLKSTSSTSNRHRSQSHLNHYQNIPQMPHDLSRSSANSASSSALSYSNNTSQSTASSSSSSNNPVNNHYYHKKSKKTDKMDISDDDEEEDDDDDEQVKDEDSKHQKKVKRALNHSPASQQKQAIVHADMIFYCFEILGNYLFNGKHHLGKHHSSSSSSSNNGQLVPSAILPPALPVEPYPLFVTWLIGTEKTLRGCIGTFSPMNLAQGLHEYAITSAINDSRFSPISRDEYPSLSCAVSILTHFEPCSSYSDWDIGLHGIRIEFVNERGGKRSATYLPEVAHEQGWNHIQTLDSLLRKGGYKATITSDMRKSVNVTRYRSEKLTLHYNDYIQSKRNSSITTTTTISCTTTTTIVTNRPK